MCIWWNLDTEVAATSFVFTVCRNHHCLLSIDACCVSFAPQMMILCNNNFFGVPLCPAITPVEFGDMEIIFAPFYGAV